MNPEELAKKLAEMETQVASLTKSNEELVKNHASLVTAVEKSGLSVQEENGAITVAKKADPEYVEVAGEKILKSAIPAVVLVQLEKANTEASELRKAAELVDLRKRATTEFPNMAGTEDHKAALLKSVEGIADSATRAEVLKSLKAADAAVAKSFEQKGSDHVDESSPSAKLNKMAQEKATASGVPFASAYAEVIKSAEGRKLATEVQASKK
jgi:hypothetical protein